MSTRFVVLLAISLFLLAGLGTGQEPAATLVGQVTDASHASVAGAEIKVRNLNTNEVRTVRTTAEGEYTVSGLVPGTYDVTVDQSGFKQLRETGLELSAAQTTRLDAHLEVGAVSQTVEVSAQTPLINSETSSRGDVVA